MKRLLLPLCVCVLFAACSSMDLPTVEESNKAIARLERSLADVDKPLQLLQQQFRTPRDLGISIRIDAINRIAKALVSQRTDDMTIIFLATRPLVVERKSLLGIDYVNRFDIDSGRVVLDLRRFEFLETRGKRLDAILTLEGEGRLHVSGRYTGVPGSASPKVHLSVRDTIRFELSAGRNGAFVLTPTRRRVLLAAIFRIDMLGWDVPWSEDIPLDVHKLIPPLTIPSMFDAAMKFPVPAASYAARNYEFETIPLRLGDSILEIREGALMYRADVRVGK